MLRAHSRPPCENNTCLVCLFFVFRFYFVAFVVIWIWTFYNELLLPFIRWVNFFCSFSNFFTHKILSNRKKISAKYLFLETNAKTHLKKKILKKSEIKQKILKLVNLFLFYCLFWPEMAFGKNALTQTKKCKWLKFAPDICSQHVHAMYALRCWIGFYWWKCVYFHSIYVDSNTTLLYVRRSKSSKNKFQKKKKL